MIEKKFRAWNRDTGEMVEAETIQEWLYQAQLLGCTGGELGVKLGTVEEEYDHLEFLLYIGLKDKTRSKAYPDGKEIYEGDITKDRIIDHETKEAKDVTRIFEVYWDDKTASFWQKLVSDPTRRFRVGTNFAAEKHCEVIGNIYEHSYLLDTKTEN